MTNHPNRSQFEWQNPSITRDALDNVRAGRYTKQDVENLVIALTHASGRLNTLVDAAGIDGDHQRSEECKIARKALVSLARGGQ